ncbi:ABC transporter ATP-binding protein [Alkalihalobacterium elongatum]|uniref:ABC transporter ATP-binding protein n=1 Tax=Alkalihalobacterium elongatum TaxID=2675466 RepID=UPI001C1F8E0A|nr:ABC transporter ATP-binding protein [Alkalihalobacterium elongatum]
MSNVVKVKRAVQSYKDFQLGPIDLNIKEGFITAVIGRNGAGKTTLLKGISHAEPFLSGEVQVANISYDQDRVNFNETICYVSEEMNMYSYFTVQQAIDFVSSFYPNWDIELEDRLLNEFKLPPKKQIHHLSKGMKLKLNMLLALCFHPKVLILDEPTAGLDPVARQELLMLLQQWIETGEKTVILSSHITTDFEQIADYVIFLKEGQVLLYEEKEQLKENYLYFTVSPQTNLPKTGIYSYQKGMYETTGIIDRDQEEQFEAQYRPATLDEILYYVVERGPNHAILD